MMTNGRCPSPPLQVTPKFETLDLESCSGRYDTVCCLDVMIHYPQVRCAVLCCAVLRCAALRTTIAQVESCCLGQCCAV